MANVVVTSALLVVTGATLVVTGASLLVTSPCFSESTGRDCELLMRHWVTSGFGRVRRDWVSWMLFFRHGDLPKQIGSQLFQDSRLEAIATRVEAHSCSKRCVLGDKLF